MVKAGRIRPPEATEEVSQTRRRAERTTRRGKLYTIAAFARTFPHEDPYKRGTTFERTCPRTGLVTRYLKVYKDDDGVESFSEGDEVSVKHTTTVDDGYLQLDAEQMQSAYRETGDVSLQMTAAPSVRLSELAVAPLPAVSSSSLSAPAAVPQPVKRNRRSDKNGNGKGSASSSEGSDAQAAPLRKALRINIPLVDPPATTNPTTTGQQQAPPSSGAPSAKGKAATKAAQAKPPAESVRGLQKAYEVGNELAKQLAIAIGRVLSAKHVDMELIGELGLLAAQLKACTISVLQKGNRTQLVGTIQKYAEQAKAIQAYGKAYAAWQKGRASPANRKRMPTPSLTRLETLFIEATKELKRRVNPIPMWLHSGAFLVELDGALAQKAYTQVLDMFQAASLASKHGTKREATAALLEPLFTYVVSDILQAANSDVEVKQYLSTMVTAMRGATLYELSEATSMSIKILGVLIKPETNTHADLLSAVDAVSAGEAKNDVFWVMVLGSTAGREFLEGCRRTLTTMREEELAVADLDKFTKAIKDALQPPIEAGQVATLQAAVQGACSTVATMAQKHTRAAFVEERLEPTRCIVADAAAVLQSLDAEKLFKDWSMLCLDSDLWGSRLPDGEDVTGCLSMHAVLKDMWVALDACAFGNLQPGDLLADDERRSIIPSLDLRVSVLRAVQACRRLHAVVKQEGPSLEPAPRPQTRRHLGHEHPRECFQELAPRAYGNIGYIGSLCFVPSGLSCTSH